MFFCCLIEVIIGMSGGEGWGLPIMEAMASGLPVIVTNASGHLDFATPERAYLIPVDHMSSTKGVGFDDTQQWAEPSVPALRNIMWEGMRPVLVHTPAKLRLLVTVQAA